MRIQCESNVHQSRGLCPRCTSTQLPWRPRQIFTSASHHIASRNEQIRGTQCVARRSTLTAASRHERARHALFRSSRARRNCAIQFNPDWNHLWKWIGINWIGSGLGECTFSVNALKLDFNAHWVPSVNRPLQFLFESYWSHCHYYYYDDDDDAIIFPLLCHYYIMPLISSSNFVFYYFSSIVIDSADTVNISSVVRTNGSSIDVVITAPVSVSSSCLL